ncbi:MAG TPA: hypothetical protein DG048_08690, partial [Pseudoalteromonas sp.]|nr:hypothetical protein [Pseudoalteromonas sp.]
AACTEVAETATLTATASILKECVVMCILLIFWLSLNQKDAPLEKLRKSTKHVMLILKIKN